jgi:hypothetical protein
MSEALIYATSGTPVAQEVGQKPELSHSLSRSQGASGGRLVCQSVAWSQALAAWMRDSCQGYARRVGG